MNLRKLFGLKQPPQAVVVYDMWQGLFVVKARGGPHGYDWEQIIVNGRYSHPKLALARAEEYAEEIGGKVYENEIYHGRV